MINTGHKLPPLTHKIGSRKMPGGTQQIFVRVGSAPRSNQLPFLYTIFYEKGTPIVLVYLLLINGTPLTYLV